MTERILKNTDILLRAIERLRRGDIDVVNESDLTVNDIIEALKDYREISEQYLKERIKGMDTLYTVSKLTRSMLGRGDFLSEVMEALPKAMLYPEDARVMIRLADQVYQSDSFVSKSQRLIADIITQEGFAGQITLAYANPHPGRDIGPFRQEEQDLLDEIAAMVSYFIERQKTEEKLKLTTKVFECIKEGICITDANGQIQSVNQSFSQITGYSFADVYQQNLRMLKSGKHPQEFYLDLWTQLETKGNWSGEIWNRRKNGEVYPEWLSITKVTDDNDRVLNYIGLFMDISSLKEADERILFLAHHDPLTGLPNRTLLRDRVQQAFCQADREGTKVGFLYLDLDNFKYVNDSQGHPAGDKLLKQVSECIRSCVRNSDTVSRLGGDEFAVVLSNMRSPFYLAGIAEKILTSVSNAVSIDQQAMRVSFSIGAAIYPDDGEDFDTLLKLADTALYEAKESGKNTYKCFTPVMAQSMLQRVSIDKDLLLAIKLNQFFLEYQPQFDIASGKVIGMEAFIRWQHPKLGIIPPSRFIPVAEQSSLIGEIGDWVLRESCRQNKIWHDAGYSLPIAVNLSPCQFARYDMSRLVKEALELSGLPPSLLELEITESVLSKNTEVNLKIVQTLRAHGVRFSIDDFGTGYSSMTYLQRFSVNRLKIDQSFIRDVMTNKDDANIVTGIIKMAESMGMNTIAEGVETQEQCDFLRDTGCTELQGFLLGPPLSQQEMTRLLVKQANQTHPAISQTIQ